MPADRLPRLAATIFADASFCPRSKAAGWAMWAKTGGLDALVAGGPIKVPCALSWEAEACALANAVSTAHRYGYLGADGEAVMLQSDCLRTLSMLLTHVPGTVERRHEDGAAIPGIRLRFLSAVEVEALDVIQACACEAGVSLILRHVRGHTTGAGRQWVNRQCDRIAKQHMNVQRAERNAPPFTPLPGEIAGAAHAG